jgi:hypothetical protein
MHPEDEPPDYSPRYYKPISLNRKRQIIAHMREELQDQYHAMLEQALEHSDMQAAKDVIMHVKTLK